MARGYSGIRPDFLVGLVDEVRLYHRALSSNEIAAIYNAGSAGKYIASNLPIITSQPQSQTNFVGATVTFQVGATNSIPVGYQWRKNSTNLVDGGNLVGTHTNTLTIMNIAYSDAAIYSVIVSNANGSVTSSNAILTVLPPRAATGIATLTGSFVTGVSITDGGGGYTNTPLVRFIGGGGSGAGAYAVVSNGIVMSITITNAGYGYTNAPQVVIDPPIIFNPVLGIAPMSFLSFSNLTIGGTYQLQQSCAVVLDQPAGQLHGQQYPLYANGRRCVEQWKFPAGTQSGPDAGVRHGTGGGRVCCRRARD